MKNIRKKKELCVKCEKEFDSECKNRKIKEGKIEAFDKSLELIDSLLRNQGKSNMVSKSEIEELRNKIVSLQVELDA